MGALSSKVAVVTGASRGIGKGIALRSRSKAPPCMSPGAR